MNIRILAAETRAFVLALESGREYELQRPAWTSYLCDGVPRRAEAPAHFVTDFASVPRPLWAWIPPTGKYSVAAILHDWMYVSHGASRAEADAVFHALMRFLGVGAVRARLMYWGVRIGGGKAYHRHDKEY